MSIQENVTGLGNGNVPPIPGIPQVPGVPGAGNGSIPPVPSLNGGGVPPIPGANNGIQSSEVFAGGIANATKEALEKATEQAKMIVGRGLDDAGLMQLMEAATANSTMAGFVVTTDSKTSVRVARSFIKNGDTDKLKPGVTEDQAKAAREKAKASSTRFDKGAFYEYEYVLKPIYSKPTKFVGVLIKTTTGIAQQLDTYVPGKELGDLGGAKTIVVKSYDNAIQTIGKYFKNSTIAEDPALAVDWSSKKTSKKDGKSTTTVIAGAKEVFYAVKAKRDRVTNQLRYVLASTRKGLLTPVNYIALNTYKNVTLSQVSADEAKVLNAAYFAGLKKKIEGEITAYQKLRPEDAKLVQLDANSGNITSNIFTTAVANLKTLKVHHWFYLDASGDPKEENLQEVPVRELPTKEGSSYGFKKVKFGTGDNVISRYDAVVKAGEGLITEDTIQALIQANKKEIEEKNLQKKSLDNFINRKTNGVATALWGGISK